MTTRSANMRNLPNSSAPCCPPWHDKKLMAAMKNHSGADDATLKKGLMWGSGPLINVAMLIPKEEGGKTSTPHGGYRLGSNIIDVGIGDVGRYQTGQDVRITARGHVPYV